MLFNLGFTAPLLGAFKPSIILFRTIAPHHLVRILDVLSRHRHGAPTTAYGHTTFTHPPYAIKSTITGCYTYQHQLVHLHLGRYEPTRTRHEPWLLHQSIAQCIAGYPNL